MQSELKDRILFLRGVLFQQAERYQSEAGALLKQSESCLLEDKGKLLLQAYHTQGITRGIVEAMDMLEIALNPPPANDTKPKLILAGGNETIN